MEHTSKSGKAIPAKVFSAQIICPCRLQCPQKIDVVSQKAHFNYFYKLNNWSEKTKFLRSLIKRNSVEENPNPRINLKQRNFVSKYFLADGEGKRQQICSSFLSKLLQINRTTLFRAAQSAEKNPNAVESRGKYPTIKTDARNIQFVKTFIQKFPTFGDDQRYEYLHPRLNINKTFIVISAKQIL